MTIRELSDRVGLSTETLRFYDREGLLRSKRKANGYRDFSEESVDQVLFLKTAQSLGFTLEEIRKEMEAVFFLEFDFHRVETHLKRQLEKIDDQIATLETRKARIRAIMDACAYKPIA